MTDHIKAAHSLHCAILLICDANNHTAPDKSGQIERLRQIIAQLGLEAEELRLSTLRIIKGDKE